MLFVRVVFSQTLDWLRSYPRTRRLPIFWSVKWTSLLSVWWRYVVSSRPCWWEISPRSPFQRDSCFCRCLRLTRWTKERSGARLSSHDLLEFSSLTRSVITDVVPRELILPAIFLTGTIPLDNFSKIQMAAKVNVRSSSSSSSSLICLRIRTRKC